MTQRGVEDTDEEQGRVRACAGPGAFRTVMSVSGHPMVADEPEEYGGGGEGPSPYDLMAAALASCTAMTLRLYLERKGWNFEAVEVEVRHGKIHARDCADCETRSGKVDRFVRRLAVKGNLDAGQRERLVEIASRCPVHRTLESEIRVETELVAVSPAN